jgi:hypothetical protein
MVQVVLLELKVKIGSIKMGGYPVRQAMGLIWVALLKTLLHMEGKNEWLVLGRPNASPVWTLLRHLHPRSLQIPHPVIVSGHPRSIPHQ